MTRNKFFTNGKRTAKATRDILRDVYRELAPSAQAALLDESKDYHVRYAFGHGDTSAIGTGIILPTCPGSWYPTGFREMGYFERENWNWKPLRLTSQGYKYLHSIRIDDYATIGYSAGSYVQLGIKRVTEEQKALGNEVYVRPANFYRHFTHANRIHGCWSWSGEDFQIWVRPIQQTEGQVNGQ
jgi:hypothetical protein